MQRGIVLVEFPDDLADDPTQFLVSGGGDVQSGRPGEEGRFRGAGLRTGRRAHGPEQFGCQILGGCVGVSVAGCAQERRAPVVFRQGFDQRDLTRREAVREVEDDQSQIVQSGRCAGL